MDKTRSLAVAAAATIALVFASGCGSDQPASDGGSENPLKIAADNTSIHEAIFGFMQSYCDPAEYAMEFEVVTGSTRYFDRLTWLQKGQVDISASGYQVLPVAAEQNLPVVAIAGTNLGAMDLVVPADSNISSLQDLEGKQIGIGTGSITGHLLQISLAENGIDLDTVELVTMPPGPQATVALTDGEVDGIVSWEPWISKTVVDGDGKIPFDYAINDVGPLNGLLQVMQDKKDDPRLPGFVRCMVDATEYLNNNPDKKLDAMVEWTGLPREVIEHAAPRLAYDTNLYLPSTENYARSMFNFQLAKADYSAQMPTLFDYSLLEQATGKSADELGRALPAPARNLQ